MKKKKLEYYDEMNKQEKIEYLKRKTIFFILKLSYTTKKSKANEKKDNKNL